MGMEPESSTTTLHRFSQLTTIALVLLGLFLPLSETGKQCAIILIIIASSVCLVKQYRAVKFDIVDWSLLIFLLSSLLSVFFAKDFYESVGAQYDIDREVHALYSFVRVVLVFYAVRYVDVSGSAIEIFLFVVVASCMLAIGYGEFRVLSGMKKFLELKGVGHVNHSSIYSAMVCLISLNLSLYYGKKIILYPIAFVVSFCTVLQSGSRASFLAVLVGIVGHFLRDRKDSRKIFFVLLAVAGATAVVVYFNELTWVQMKKGFYSPGRIFIWKVTLSEWLKHNIFFGIGPNNSYYVNPVSYAKSLRNGWTHLGHSHNTFLTILLENGLVGLISYCVFVISIFLKLFFCKIGKCASFLMIGIDISIVNFINSFANTTFSSSSNEILMVVIWAISLRCMDGAVSRQKINLLPVLVKRQCMV